MQNIRLLSGGSGRNQELKACAVSDGVHGDHLALALTHALHYGALGFTKISEQENGDSEWELEIDNYENKNKVIKVVTSNEQN